MRTGEHLAVQARAATPAGAVVRGTATASFTLAGAQRPAHAAVLELDPVTRCYGAVVDTGGWVPGDWTVRVTVTGGDGAAGAAVASFTLEPLLSRC